MGEGRTWRMGNSGSGGASWPPLYDHPPPLSLSPTLALSPPSPGLWSQIKRAPKAKRVRKVYEVPGPSVPGAMPLDARARQIFQYFKVRGKNGKKK